MTSLNGLVDLQKFDSLFKIISTVHFLPYCSSLKVQAQYTQLVSLSEINSEITASVHVLPIQKGGNSSISSNPVV